MKQAIRFTNRHRAIVTFFVLTVFAGFSWIVSGVHSQNAVTVEDKYAVHIADAPIQGSDSLQRYGALRIAADEKSAGNTRVAVAADFDADGVQDLLVAQNDRLVLHRGNINAFAPQTEVAWEAIRDGRFISPFERKTRSTSVPAAADFIFSGDFNRDGKLDAVVAARNDNSIYVLEGDGAGNFPNLRRIETAGAITALAAGDVNRADGLADLIVGTRGENDFGLQIFSGLGDISTSEPIFYNLPAQAEAIAVGQLNENDFNDIAVGTDSEVLILSGKDSTQTDGESNPEMLRLPQPGGVKSIVTGDLMPDRDNRAELGVLSPDGTLRILARGALDTRPVTATEHLAEQVRDYQAKGYPIPQRILKRLSKTDLRNPLLRPQSNATNWAEAETMTTAAPNSQLSPQSVLTTGHISNGAVEDLIVLDQSASRVVVMPFQLDESKIDAQNTRRSFDGKRAVQEFAADGGAPVAAFALKLNYDNEEDLLVLKDAGESVAIVSAPQATFTVNSAADAIDNNLNDNVCSTAGGVCTLRAAIMQANRTAGNDTIMINAGINPTILLGQPDNDAGTPNDQATGDLDITCVISNPSSDGCNTPLSTNLNNLSIIGAAGGNTVSAGTFSPYPVNGGGTINTDRVFDVGQDGIFGGGFGGGTGLSATFTNLTIQNGNVRQAENTSLGAGNYANGGGIRYDGFGNGFGTLTLNNTTVTNNQADNAGGGVYQVYGTFSAGSGGATTFSSNIAKAGEGGGVFFGAATSNSNVSITNSTFNANEARQGNVFGTFTANADGGGIRFSTDLNTLSISNTNFTNNIAQQDGGAIKTLNGAATVSGGTMTGNTARRHGGVNFGDQDTPGGGRFLTFSGSTMRNNTANSDNTIFAGDGAAGDGGAIFRDRGVLNISGCTIGGTNAGEPNTATNGGGVAHDFTVDSAAGNTSNQTTININGGTINGNVANTDGGGIYFNAATFDVTASALNIGASFATTLTGNKAKNNGGGIHISNAATATLKDMVLRSNQANSDSSGGGDGGALYQDTAATVTTFTGTLTVGGSGTANSAVNGGGIRNNAGTITIPASPSITFNTASGTGGGISNAGTLSALATATITNNTATGNGGGIFNSGTLGAITTPALNSNSAANGGGIYTSNGILTVTNGTINSNTATASGGGGGILYAGSGNSTVTGASVNGNIGSGIYITANALDVTNTIISSNSADGISKTGTGTGSELINGNTISSNGSLGIDLGDNGVTPNDAAGDADTGPNNLQNYPVINFVRRGDGIGNATLNSTANRTFRINFFANTTCDPSGFGEGEVSLGTQNVTTNASGTVTFTTAALAFGAREQITATATDTTTGDTSEFSACRAVNTLPTITAQSGVTRQQGSPISNSQIATVADPDQALNTLAVTIRAVGGAAPGTGTATVNGVTVSNIAVSPTGVVTADIIATCGATNANFTLRVTDGASEFNETTLTVTVTPNTAPTVGNYANTTVNVGSGVTVTPDAAPTDNGSIASITATASAGFTGTFSTNTTTGAVTITNAAPAGTYTITVTTTDNCGLATTKTFTLTVNAIPTITAQSGVTRQQGSAATNSQIATVNDTDQTEETLIVTIRAVGGAAPGTGTATVNGVTVSNIAVSAAGVVTADIVAACGATNASFTLRVTDANGAFSEATLNVAVTNNTAPTAGTYANTTVNLGGSTTVTPTAAPADNGTFTATASSSAGFTGTLAVNQTTGVVTVTNAAPAGAYTITVTFTDGCTLATSRTFTLTVNSPPTISAASGVTRQQANGTSNSQIATVNDPDQTKNTLVFTIRAVGAAAPGTGTATVNGITVSNILVSAAGVVTADITATANATAASFTLRVTDNQGSFAETTLDVAVTPASYEADVFARPNGDTFVDADDIQQLRNFSIGLNLPYQSNEFQRADCAPRSSSGDGFVDADDVQQARRYSVATDAKQVAAGPTAPPMNLLRLQTAKSFVEAATGFSDLNAPEATPAFRIGNQTSSAGRTVTVPIIVDTAGNEAGYTFSLSYDSTVLTNPQVTIGTAGGDVFSNTMTAGQIGFSVTSFTGGTIAAGTNMLLVTVRFTVASNAPTGPTTISFTDTPARRKVSGIDPNTPIQQPTYMNGTVTITAPTAATVSIGGRVQTSSGRGISGVRLTLTDQSGRSRTATSTDFGYYQFEDVEVGATYILSASGKRLTFSQSVQVLNVNEASDRIDFTVETEKKSKNF